MSLYLFDIDGHPIAFRRRWDDAFVFAVDGRFLGYQPWQGGDVVDASGHYLGSIVGDRLVRRNDAHGAGPVQVVPDPGPAVPPGAPSRPLSFEHRFAYEDICLPRTGRPTQHV